jgi:Mg2+-importing ATPase
VPGQDDELLDLREAARTEATGVLDRVGSGAEGLTAAEAARRLAVHGPNALASHGARPWEVLVRQLRNPLLVLLVGAAAVSAFTGGISDAVIIGVIVSLSVGLGFVNEYRSEQAVEALHSQVHHRTTVLRDGKAGLVDVSDLVPGDLVTLRVGDIVPADLRLCSATDLECDEGVLTGESVAAVKQVEPVAGNVAAADTPGADLASCALMGTIVRQGAATGVVVRTGPATEFGKIAVGLGERQAETAFQLGLRQFSTLLVKVAGVLTIGIFAINLILHRPFLEAMLFSLAIAIGLTPQLLPAIVTVSLSNGTRRLAERKVLVKRLVAIEDLGNITTLFTDKTGTLTEGEITFDRGLDADGEPSARPLLLGLLCNDAAVTDGLAVSGNQLDVALWNAAAATNELGAAVAAHHRIAALPFDHDRRLASVLVAPPDGGGLLVVKGEPEGVLRRCPAAPSSAQQALDALFDLGARVIAVASTPLDPATHLVSACEEGLTFEGFLVFTDRPKADAADSLHRLTELGVATKVITGDSARVARKVCGDLGIDVSNILTGDEIDALDDTALAAAIVTTFVYARMSPEQKARIVQVARRDGEDVAFLGDGVNDAVALHHADVGISVDTATDVAKDAADILLLDKDLGVLADGIHEGRRIFANTMKYVLMATSSNFGNMFSAAGASLFLTFLPLLPSQILLNNLLYDVGQMTIPTDHVDEEMLGRPAQWDIGFIRRFMAFFGPISSLFDFLTFFVLLRVIHASHDEFRSGWFVESLATQTLVIFVIRTRRIPFVRSKPSRPLLVAIIAVVAIGAILPFSPLAKDLGFTSLPPSFLALLVGMVVAYLALAEAGKRWFYRSVAARNRAPVQHIAVLPRHERRIQRRAARFSHQRPIRRPATHRRQGQRARRFRLRPSLRGR